MPVNAHSPIYYHKKAPSINFDAYSRRCSTRYHIYMVSRSRARWFEPRFRILLRILIQDARLLFPLARDDFEDRWRCSRPLYSSPAHSRLNFIAAAIIYAYTLAAAFTIPLSYAHRMRIYGHLICDFHQGTSWYREEYPRRLCQAKCRCRAMPPPRRDEEDNEARWCDWDWNFRCCTLPPRGMQISANFSHQPYAEDDDKTLLPMTTYRIVMPVFSSLFSSMHYLIFRHASLQFKNSLTAEAPILMMSKCLLHLIKFSILSIFLMTISFFYLFYNSLLNHLCFNRSILRVVKNL